MEAGKYQSQAARIEALMQDVAAFPEPQVRTKVEELLLALLDIYGAGLQRILEITAGAEITGQALIEMVASDELVSALLVLHGLHPLSLETRLLQALESIRPAVQAQGGALEFVRLEDGVATLRLTGGSCQGCQSSQTALRQMVEEALYSAAPDLDKIQMEENTPRQVGIPVKFIELRQRKPGVATSASASVVLGQDAGRPEVR